MKTITRRCKRRWNWKEKHVRKHACTRNKGHWYNVPKFYTKELNKSNRRKEKRALHKLSRGVPEDLVDLTPKYRQNCAGWFWF